MKYLGNLTEDQVIDFKFSTHKADGTPITLAGTPVIKVYKANAAGSETATGVTLTVDFDSVTGMHNVHIDTSTDAFYAIANDYSVVITTGTVDSVSVVGTVLATFSIENRFKEVDVTTWLGIAPLALSSQRVQAVVPDSQKVDVETIKTKAVTVSAGGTTFPSGTVAKAGDAMALTSDERTTLLAAIWAVATTTLTTAGSIGKWLLDNAINAASYTGAFPAAALVNAPTHSITPLSSTVSAGEVSSHKLTSYQGHKLGPFVFTVLDSTGGAVNLDGKVVHCDFAEIGATGSPLFSLSSTAGEITISSTDYNVVTVDDDDTHTTTAGLYQYRLVNQTDDAMVDTGTWKNIAGVYST